MLTPGQYLMKRREAAGLSLSQAAGRLVTLERPGRPARLSEVAALEDTLEAAEADRVMLPLTAVAELARIFAFAVDVYGQLVDLHVSGELAAEWLPHPRLCRTCGCSFHDPCHTPDGPCGWSVSEDGEDPALCTACDPTHADPTRRGPLRLVERADAQPQDAQR